MKTKKTISFFLIIVLMASMLSLPSNAVLSTGSIIIEEPSLLTPDWQHTTQVITDLTFSSRTATCTGRAGMRIVVDLRRDVNPHVILNQLYKFSQLQDTFSMNMLALVNGEPI